MELKYCPNCIQMTNHEVVEYPLVKIYICLKCKNKKQQENKIQNETRY